MICHYCDICGGEIPATTPPDQRYQVVVFKDTLYAHKELEWPEVCPTCVTALRLWAEGRANRTVKEDGGERRPTLPSREDTYVGQWDDPRTLRRRNFSMTSNPTEEAL